MSWNVLVRNLNQKSSYLYNPAFLKKGLATSLKKKKSKYYQF